jgi:alkylated DNA nucleotide flippase Atl1
VAPILWDVDGQPWRPTTLARRILADAGLPEHAVRGPAWWVVDGTYTDLATLADGVQGNGRFDWTPLHNILDRLPAGRWASYGDVAAVVGTAAQPLGSHIVRCEHCVNGHRILGANGRIPPGFRWSDPARTDDPVHVLQSEGVRFQSGRADEGQRLTAAELAGLSRNTVESDEAPSGPAAV